MPRFLRWLFQRRDEALDPKKVEVNQRNMAQTKQLVESSQRHLQRATVEEQRARERLQDSSDQLKHALDVIVEKMQHIREKGLK